MIASRLSGTAPRYALRWLLGGLLLAALQLRPTCAWAQERDELARRHFESGEAYFAEAEYSEALKAFWKAYELSNRPEILLSVAVVEERLHNLKGAVLALDRYLEQNPDAADGDTVRLRREKLQRRLRAEPPPDATAAASERQAAPPTPVQAPAAEPNLMPAYISLSVGALAGAGALLTGLGAQVQYDKLEEECARRQCDKHDIGRGERLALASTLLTGVAVLGIGVGATLWATADSPPAQTASAAPTLQQVNIQLGTSASFAEARWSF